MSFNDLFNNTELRRKFECSVNYLEEHYYDYCKRILNNKQWQIH